MMEQFVTGEVQHVMTTDALETSHPISIKVHHPDEINEIFDRISYEKGKIVLSFDIIAVLCPALPGAALMHVTFTFTYSLCR